MKNENTGNLRTFRAHSYLTSGGKKRSQFAGTRKRLALLALSVSVVLSIGQSGAQTIVYDSFSNGSGTANIGGTSPDTSLAGTTWVSQSFGGYYPTVDYGMGVAYTFPYGSASIGIASAGGYVKPSILTISASLSVNLLTGSDGLGRGIGIGYYGALPGPGFYPNSYFSGFTVATDGSLGLWIPNGGEQLLHSVAAFDGFSTSESYNLSFTVDTTTGNIVSVVFGAQDYTSEFTSYTGYFGDSVTNNAGFFGFSTSENPGGIVDNFTVASVPEPSTYGLAFCGVLVLTTIALRSRRAGASV